MKYSVRPIALCEAIRDMSKDPRCNVGTKVKGACYIWYIERSDPVLLVDVGINEGELEVAACGPHTDSRDAYDSAGEVADIIPCHDPQFMDLARIP
jgi:hypothetical protein